MDKELQDTLFEKYDHLFRNRKLPRHQTCMCWGIDTGNGWYEIMEELCSKIQKYADETNNTDLAFEQVKEKFGFLRVYVAGNSFPNETVDRFIAEAEAASAKTCEVTGKEGKIRRDLPWQRVLCEEEYQKTKEEAKKRGF